MKHGVFCSDAWKCGEEWGAWFRIFGWGLVATTLQPMFSERYGYQKTLRVCGIKLAVLKP